ncbi:MAG TPA: aminotransferase class I/II-fold pyridoxal phosphate-dependent enzyme [Acidobacteriaceae bacterium]|nr:aminotransferase class I/II-fold pyridoxal phosphate-dependent enzyme [Acidobacteriaceae bacterium]
MVAAYYPVDDDALLDWNECPIGPPPLAVKRVVDAANRLHRYPRGLTEEVTASAAGYFGVATEQLMLTSGVDEATDITLSLGAQAWGLEPGFDGYRDRATAMGKPFRPIPLGRDWQPVAPLMPDPGGEDIVYLAQPNNPTGNFLTAGWLDTALATGSYIFVDETYQEFSSQRSLLEQLPQQGPRLLIYRSLSKAAGLAGIRLGCVIGDPVTIARLYPLRRFMPIDAVSLNAALGLFEEPGFIKQVVSYVRDARAALTAVLHASRIFDEVCESAANFVLAKPSAAAHGMLAGQFALDRVRVKDCTVLGLPGWLRISVGSADDQRRLAESLNCVAVALST